MTRLLIVNPSPVRGGAEELLIGFATRSQRVQTTVACLWDGPFVDDLLAQGVDVRRMRAGRLRHVWNWAAVVRRIAALARDVDAVLSWQVKGHYYGTPAARIGRKPAAWWDHGVRPAAGEARYLIDNRLPASLKADVVVTSSHAAAARHRGGRAIHPGIDLEPYERSGRAAGRDLLGMKDDDPAIGIVGRLQPWKNQHVFLRAVPSILQRHPRARFFVIGGTPGGFSAGYPSELRALATELGVADHVTFMGQRDDVPALLAGLDVFVMASDAEPFGLVTVEAMAAGVPVVATRAGGTPEIVAHERTGLLVPVGDARALADAVVRYLADPAWAGSIARSAREDARRRFSMERFVTDVEDLVLELAGRQR